MDRDSTAWFALDISMANDLIAQIAKGHEPDCWPHSLLQQIHIVEVDANAAHALAPFGRSTGMVGRTIVDFWPAESWKILAEVILAVAADFPAGAPTSRPMTSLAYTDARINASTDPNGAAPNIVFISAGGVVANQQSLWSLTASEMRYRNLIHHLPFALLQVDSTAMLPIFEQLRSAGLVDIDEYLQPGSEFPLESRNIVRVTDANLEAVALFGAQRVEQLVGRVDYLFAAAPETAKRVIRAHFEGCRTYAEQMKVRRFDGSLIDVEMSVTYPTAPERLEVTLITLVDVTERLRTDAQLRQLQADYTRAARISMLGELATSIAHEVNQPLSAIVTNAETSLRWIDRPVPNLPKVKELTGRIAESGRQASDIVKRIRGMAARRTPERLLVDIGEVVAEALMFVRHDFEARSIELLFERASHLPPVWGDRVQLQQVIVNLVINAQQAFLPDGQERLIEIGTYLCQAGEVAITVADNGPGIAEADLGLVFESFYTTKHEGVGIGLAICQSIIDAHGGTISVRNRPQGGATFMIRLPASSQPWTVAQSSEGKALASRAASAEWYGQQQV
jgi:signal transduction histidine kinase